MKKLAMVAAAMMVSGSVAAEDQYLIDLFEASEESTHLTRIDEQRSVSAPEVGDSSVDQYLVDLFEASDEDSRITHIDEQRSVSAPDVGDSSTDDYLSDLFKTHDVN